MTKHEFYILNDLYNGRQGRGGCTSDIDRTRALDDQAAINALTDAGLIARDTGALTEAGLRALEPYRVDNAVILAAGASTRFIPLSLEQPKGLFEVKGERLIERQIQQLKAAGIDDISQKAGCLLFSLPKFDLAAVSALCGGKYKSRMLFAAGDKPYLSLRLW